MSALVSCGPVTTAIVFSSLGPEPSLIVKEMSIIPDDMSAAGAWLPADNELVGREGSFRPKAGEIVGVECDVIRPRGKVDGDIRLMIDDAAGRIEAERIVSGVAPHQVASAPAAEHIIADTAVDFVRASGTIELVVALAAVERIPALPPADLVIAGIAIEVIAPPRPRCCRHPSNLA